MEKEYLNESEHAEDDGSKTEHQGNKQFRVRKKQMYIKLLNQMEFYFSCSNLAKDRFIAKLIAEDPYVPLSTFLSFNKISQILRTYLIPEEKHIPELAKSVSKSTILELSEDKTKIQLKADVPKKTQEEIDECTVYVEQIPINSTHDSLKLIFSKYGKVNYVSLPRYKKSRQIKQFCFIEFDDPASVQNVVTAFKKIDGVLQGTSVKPENLLSIATFEKDDHCEEPPLKKAKLDSQEPENTETNVPEKEDECDDENVKKDEDEKASDKEAATADDSTTTDSPKKKKRKHKRRNTAKNKLVDEHLMSMKVMRKNEWKKLRNAYLNLERQKAKEIKKILRESYNKRTDNKSQAYSALTTKVSPKINFYGSPNERSSENVNEPVTEPKSDLQSGNLVFTPGCIVNIKFREPCVEFKEFKKELKQFPSVQYVDIMEGGSQCFIRVNASQAAHELVNHYSSCEYETEILKDDLEKDYWKKIIDSREKKKKNEDKSKPNPEKRIRRRGREKLVDKISKATQNQIIKFGDFDEHTE
ncbi:la-related protein 7 [Chironomus tepperi]|uniref:la-related protein 7 n=1 Tax=Chironomus tepperi TaxID=113505 RepID=UPI00391F8C39